MEPRDVGLVVLCANAPWAVVLIVAALRGYRVRFHMDKRPREDDRH